MKVNLTQLIIASGLVPLSIIGIAQPSLAQENNRGARFSFAPNVWKTEAARVPTDSDHGPMPAVRNGAVPQGTNFLGVDPEMLVKPKPQVIPQAVPRVAATPVTTNVTANMPATKMPFNPAFGRPFEQSAPNTTALPTPPAIIPKQAVAKSMPKPQAILPVAGKHVRQSSTAVKARLLRRPKGSDTGMQAVRQVANYGPNFGYVPGGYLPAHSTGSVSARTEVRGRLLNK